MTRTPADLLDKTYNRQVFSNPVSLPATNLPYLDGVRFVYNLGRLKSYNDDRAELLVDLNEEAKAEGKAFEDYCSAWQEQWGGADTDADFITDATDELVARTVALENYKVAWRTRVRLRIAAFLIERVEWGRTEPAPDPCDEVSLLKLEPDTWANHGEVIILNMLTDFATDGFVAKEVASQIQSPFWIGRSMATGGKS